MTAAEFLRANTRVATVLSARDIETHIPAAIRQVSVFSARTVYAHHLDETQKDVAELLEGKMGANEIRNKMQDRLEKLNYAPDPADRGGLRDLSSDARTNLIIDMQEQRSRGYAVWRSQQQDTTLKVWPANEMFRALARKVPRKWKERWNTARAALGEEGTSATYATSNDGPFIALKNDAIWTSVSRFGSPWPPFDYQSGMRLKQVKASAARQAGVLKPGAPGPTPARDPMRQVEQASCAGMSEPLVSKWVSAFGDRARVVGGKVLVCPDASVIEEVLDTATTDATAEAVFSFAPEAAIKALSLADDATLSLSADTVRSLRTANPVVADADIKALADTVREAGEWIPAKTRGSVATFTTASGISTLWRKSSTGLSLANLSRVKP